jgi:hypothetical protein
LLGPDGILHGIQIFLTMSLILPERSLGDFIEAVFFQVFKFQYLLGDLLMAAELSITILACLAGVPEEENITL